MIFHGVVGRERFDSGSPSYYNMEEIDIVEYYVRKLVDDSIVAAKDIGIITPYRKQVLESMQSNEIT